MKNRFILQFLLFTFLGIFLPTIGYSAACETDNTATAPSHCINDARYSCTQPNQLFNNTGTLATDWEIVGAFCRRTCITTASWATIDGTANCHCKADFYRSGATPYACTACNATFQSPAGSTKPDDCTKASPTLTVTNGTSPVTANAGGSVTQTGTNTCTYDIKCNAGYRGSQIGYSGASPYACPQCPANSFSAANSSVCTPCAGGTKNTTAGANQASCNVACANSANMIATGGWEDAVWNVATPDTVTNVCVIKTTGCLGGFHVDTLNTQNNQCDPNTFTVTYVSNGGGGTNPGSHTCTYGSTLALRSVFSLRRVRSKRPRLQNKKQSD